MINRTTLRLLKEDIDAALAAVSAKHNVLLTLGTARFSSTDASMTLSVSVANQSTIAQVVAGVSPRDVKARSDYTAMAAAFGLKAEWLGRDFVAQGKTLQIVGLLPNKRKNNVLIEGTGGGKYIMSPADVLKYIK